MFNLKLFFSLAVFTFFLIITSLVKNQSRIIEKQIKGLNIKIIAKEKNISEAEMEFSYLSSPNAIEKKFNINFIPIRGNFSRGIFCTSYIKTELDIDSIYKIYFDFYNDHPFTVVSNEEIHLKQVINTNKCLIHLKKIEGKLLITSIIDNLIKGASGQAIQNMNLMFGFDETTGLKLKSSIF